MFKAFVRVDQNTDADGTTRRLTERATSGQAAPNVVGLVLEHNRTVIEALLERGTALFNMGRQMSVSQSIDGPGYSITIHVRFGTRESIWGRIFGVLRRQHCV